MTKEGQAIAINTKNNKVFDKNIYTAVNDELKKYIQKKIFLKYIYVALIQMLVFKKLLLIYLNKTMMYMF